jgi:hypothetical protein
MTTYIYCAIIQSIDPNIAQRRAWGARWFASLTAAVAAIRKDPSSKRVDGRRPRFDVQQHVAVLVDLDRDEVIGRPTQHEVRASCAAPGMGEIRTRGDRRCYVHALELHGVHRNVLAHKKHSSFATSFGSDSFGPFARVWNVFHQEWDRFRSIDAVSPEVLATLTEAERVEIERVLPKGVTL